MSADFDQRCNAVIERVNAVVDPVEFRRAKTGGEYAGDQLAGVKTEFTKACSVAALKT